MITGIRHDFVFYSEIFLFDAAYPKLVEFMELPTLTPRLSWQYTHNLRGVAQLEARCVWDAEARGSSPRSPTAMGNA